MEFKNIEKIGQLKNFLNFSIFFQVHQSWR
jgi:hypothetical protein